MMYFFGEWRDDGAAVTPQDVRLLCDRAEVHRDFVAAYPLDKVLSLLDRARAKWRDPGYEPRKRAEALLPAETGFSPAMVKLGLDELCWTFDPDLLQRKLDAELRGVPRGPGARQGWRSRTALRWHPLGVMLHVLAGNVFVGAAGSLVEGLITGNVNILKMSSSERVFLPLLVRSLIECDADGFVERAVAVIEYSSSQGGVISELKSRVDGIAVWGGEQAVKGYRDGLPARTKLIVFGPKLSMALVTRDGLAERGLKEIAWALADDVSLWDQNACTAPQACYVQGLAEAKRLAAEAAVALAETARKLPPGGLDAGTAVEVRKFRGRFEVAEARGEGVLKESAPGLEWTVVVDKDPVMEPSPLGRTLRLIPFEDVEEVVRQLAPLRGYLQTVGLAVSPRELQELSERLGGLGALRLVDVGRAGAGEIDDPHDGGYDLPQWMHLVFTRSASLPRDMDTVDALPPPERERLIDERLRVLIRIARRSEFYGKRLKGIEIGGVEDLEKVPILTRGEMEAHMPPHGMGLSTGAPQGGYVSRSGGSTGEPKFSFYDGRDWEAMIDRAVPVLRAAGLCETDRLANFMLAGDLYGSFVSFDHINCRVGATSFAFASSAKPEAFVDIWRRFRVNAVQGIPSVLVPLLREAKRLEPGLTLEKFIFAGTPLSSSDYEWLKGELRIERISSVIGANDGGEIAYQCSEMRGARHHTVDDFNFIEIVDDDGRRVPDGEPGRILITSLLKFAFPLIRYEIGDSGRLLTTGCPCGRSARLLEHLGRSDDTLCMGTANVRYRDFQEALKGFRYSHMQMAARSDAKGERLVLRFELESPSEDMRRRMLETLLGKVPKLKENIDAGSIRGLDIEFLAPGALPRNPRSGKVKTLIDERK